MEILGMETYEIIAIFVFPFIFFVVIKIGVKWVHKWHKSKVEEAEEEINNLQIDNFEDELFNITPYMEQSLNRLAIHNASQLRELDVNALKELLSCASNILVVFERRIERISLGYETYENAISDYFTTEKYKEVRAKETQSLKKKLDKQLDHALTVFEEDLAGVEGVLNVIPAQYRMSVILNTMIGYLADGEAGSWGDCIRFFKEDIHRMQQNQYFIDTISRLERIESNTKAAAFFSGLAAWNTRKL